MTGFTLMEMIAVSVAIAILGAISFVSYKQVYVKGLERAALASLVMYGKSSTSIYTIRKVENPTYLWQTAFSVASVEGITFSLGDGIEAAGAREFVLLTTANGNLPAYDDEGPVRISNATIAEETATVEIANTRNRLK